MAQAEPHPTEMAVTPLVRPVTCTGTELFVVESFPSKPASLSPQHSTPPAPVTAQAAPPKLLVVTPLGSLTTSTGIEPPTETAVTPLVRPVTCTGAELLV